MSNSNQSRPTQPETQIANGWTARETQAMDAHSSAKVASDPFRVEAPNSSYRQAERASDATDPMHDSRREAQANAYKSDRAIPREMTPIEQAKDYERVNGAFDRARAQEVRQYGPDGYKGDPSTNAAERRAEAMGDATMQRLPNVTQAQRDAARGQTRAALSTSASESAQRQQVATPAPGVSL